MALLDRPDDDPTKEVDGAKSAAAGVLTDATDTVAEDHDGSLISHHSTGHDLLRRLVAEGSWLDRIAADVWRF